MIAVSSVSMRYGSKVLFDDVSTTFSNGRRYGLTGPNGSGKSTVLRIMAGIDKEYDGEAKLTEGFTDIGHRGFFETLRDEELPCGRNCPGAKLFLGSHCRPRLSRCRSRAGRLSPAIK